MEEVYEYANSIGLKLSDYDIQRFAYMIMARCANACSDPQCNQLIGAKDLVAEEFNISVVDF
jgi:hypothetical protein